MPRQVALKNEVRLIGGLWRGSKLPVADRPGLRPTPGRVRETLFNWLGQDLDGWRVLDAYAGTGALGFESASRGAAEVRLLDHDASVVASLKASQQRLKATVLQVERAEARSWMARCAPARFELVFLDPPFDADIADAALQVAAPLVVDGGFLYLESAREHTELPDGLQTWRHLKAGAVHAHLLTRTTT